MSDVTVSFQGAEYTVPGWSVSILPDCKTEVYNTAKVTIYVHIILKQQICLFLFI